MARELTEKQQAFINALLPCNGNVREAMRVAGYSDTASASMLVKSLREEMIELAEVTLASGAIQAAIGLNNVVEDPTQMGAKEKISAAKEILDRTGLGKTETNKIELSTPSGIFVLPPKKES